MSRTGMSRTANATATTAAASAQRRTPAPGGPRRRRARFLLAGALAAVLLTGAAEAAATAVVEDRVEDALRPRLGPTRADLHGSGLLALLRGRADGATVSGDDAPLGPVTGAAVRLDLDGIALRGSGRGTVDAAHGRITVPAGAVRAWLGRSGLPVSEVAPDPAAGTLRLGLGPGGALTVTLRPELRDGRLGFALDGASLMGAPAPERLTQGIRERLADRPPAPAGPALEPTGVRVTTRGVEVTVGGTDLRPDGPG
ncbi:hypothetical protein ACIPW5_03785 [Streptomyces sp. NPDC090077]|uniref:hypothetical protein n=1 Tax=Streptomyces sp. NPDC090077 TaxID=3365938 RepID=UPI00382F95AF